MFIGNYLGRIKTGVNPKVLKCTYTVPFCLDVAHASVPATPRSFFQETRKSYPKTNHNRTLKLSNHNLQPQITEGICYLCLQLSLPNL